MHDVVSVRCMYYATQSITLRTFSVTRNYTNNVT